ALGGSLVRAAEPVHGRASTIHHDGCGIFAGLSPTITAARYHSLVADESTLPECLEISARANDGAIMAVRHRRLPIVGLQFHPESILTDTGYPLLATFLRQIGLTVADPLPTLSNELAG
ncbi:MAG TPA: gamma-glutamyl-gamma-aminobutyrate hydrolase family protein, partial [Thermoguttaceae bacterium]|nr:gamma-glutamyl-gamma-aminobutyrate hydrolase family protein [Thermoguttaceae bacterium]